MLTTAFAADPPLAKGNLKLTLEGPLTAQAPEPAKLIFSTALEQTVRAEEGKLVHHIGATLEIIQGEAKELPLLLAGEGRILEVNGADLQEWGVRTGAEGARTLVLYPRKGVQRLAVTITAEQPARTGREAVAGLTLAPPQPALSGGFVVLEAAPGLALRAEGATGLFPVEAKYLPASLQPPVAPEASERRAFQFHGTSYTLPLQVAVEDPGARRVTLRDFQLTGLVHEGNASFTLTATAHVGNPAGGSLLLLSGEVALTELPPHPEWRLVAEHGQYRVVFTKGGDFPLRFRFDAAVHQGGGWNGLDFHVAPGALQALTLQGLPAETQLVIAGAARPERTGQDFTSYLPPDGAVKLGWRTAAAEAEGKLFYSATMLEQISLGTGLLRQAALLEGKIMQGELDHLTVLLRGQGEVTRVAGPQVLAWKVAPGAKEGERQLVIQFNQAQKNSFTLEVQTQTPIGAFPLAVEPLGLRPEGATRCAGYLRIDNEGAVRLEVLTPRGLAQISPDQFPESDATRAAFRAEGEQHFAYRFADPDFALRIQADQILPELTVSEILAYLVGETEQSIEAEIEVEIREAPLRELLLRVPKGYAVARLTAEKMSDYAARDLEAPGEAELRLVFTEPLTGRQVVQLRLERNLPLGPEAWVLPRVEVIGAKSTRGHLGLSAEAGLRLTPERTEALNEIATAFFPRRVAGLQAAFRLSDPAWQGRFHVERLPQAIQADGFHLFSIGEGIAYGSSVLNYAISGAPVAEFKVELSDEYFNVEFTGKDLRHWEKTPGGYLVQLHTPVAGAYTLLATYERPFKAQGETLAFAGARPLDAQEEQGYTVVISENQFQVKPVEVTPGLLPLETAEVPPEYRLFFDAPILAAYRYTARPFSLQLALSPLQQGDSLSQVVDRAALVTRISKEGQVLTEARYYVKNRGHANLRVTLPEGAQLWSATVNGARVVPVKDGPAHLLPLAPQADPNAVYAVDLQLAARSPAAGRIHVAAPIVGAPLLLAEWKLEPDTARRLAYRGGSLSPVGGVPDDSGFAELARAVRESGSARRMGLAVLGLLVLAAAVWRATARPEVRKFSLRYWVGVLLGGGAFLLALLALVRFGDLVTQFTAETPRALSFLVPVQPAGQALTLEVGNDAAEASWLTHVGRLWPLVFAVLAWAAAWLTGRKSWALLGWVLAAWVTLRWPNGAHAFLVLAGFFALRQLAWPAWRRFRSMPRAPRPAPAVPAAAVASVLLFALLASAAGQAPAPKEAPPMAETVTQEVRVEEPFAFATAKLRWSAVKGQLLPVLAAPAVLTRLDSPAASLRVVEGGAAGHRTTQLLALESGTFEIEVRYQVAVAEKDGGRGVLLPLAPGLVNRTVVTVANLDVDILSPQAVSTGRRRAGNDTVATLVLSPKAEASLTWKPRSRNLAAEKAVFYAEWTQLYVPGAGAVEGLHQLSVRPAQGEIAELVIDVPKGATVTDVQDAGATDGTDRVEAKVTDGKEAEKTPEKHAPLIPTWRFDPDAGKLRVTLSPVQAKPFALRIRSQIAAGALPATQSAGVLSLEGASGQIGLLGVATGEEVQLDSVAAGTLSPINLEDFPGDLVSVLEEQITGLTVRRAFRYADAKATLTWKASPVEPDVRVESQSTLSLGEDRAVLAVGAEVEITRAGIFRLSFLLPAGMEVEAITGDAMSHWTELKSEVGKIVTVHLKERTQGKQKFSLTLTGPGLKTAKAWPAPQIAFREAGRQRGSYLVTPEQGMRLQVSAKEGVTQLDPKKAGVKQPGVLVFRVLQTPWHLTLGIEQVEPWVQVTGLQHVTVGEAQLRHVANLQYQIDNAGLKAFRLLLPKEAENVHFQGDQVADFRAVADPAPEGWQAWEVKLGRRVIGQYMLQVTFATARPADALEAPVRGVEAQGVNLQRGFVAVQAGSRLQGRVEAVPAALQPIEWPSIPRVLQGDLAGASASMAWRLVEPHFVLPLRLERHEAARLLPARVNRITLTSVLADSGALLTRVQMEIVPGDKRLLHLTLPPEAQFWFALVNQHGAWPWREAGQILLPLEQQSRGDQPMQAEFYYSMQTGAADARALAGELVAPKFDLPLEKITWKVYLDPKWRLAKWTGSLQLQDEQTVCGADFDPGVYLRAEEAEERGRLQSAEGLLALGNTALGEGNPAVARHAFSSAFALSQHDNAFNEDARVQLHNLRLQQALIGLNVRRSSLAGEPVARLNAGRESQPARYTQQQAQQIMERNSPDENAAFNHLAERLLQQQDAATTSPPALRASLPEEGLLLTFSRAVAVDEWADLRVGLHAKANAPAAWPTRLGILAAAALLAALGLWYARSLRRAGTAGGISPE